MAISGNYGTTIENCNLAIEKAKSKDDGVFRLRGLAYRVRGGNVTHFAAYGKIYELCYGFLAHVGDYKYELGDSESKALRGIK